MDALNCIKTRKSIRKFKPETVPKEILIEVIETAQRSPSYKNSQPWEVIIISGKEKDELSRLLVGLLEENEVKKPDIPEPTGWPAPVEERIKSTLDNRSKLFHIDLTDPENIKRSKKANFRFYGAPHAIFFYQDASLNEWSILDMGMFIQSVMLAANAKGLGTVPQAYLTDYSGEVRQFLGIADSKRLVLGMSIGYADMDDKINSAMTGREDLEKIVHWIE
ncbi:MAG: nitroreductase [Deltaproteobacteria bacterium]|nr:nitroreductase [Deltaproteobacteria bacterium]